MSSSGAPATTAVPETATAAPTRAPRDASWAISVCGGAQAPSSPLNVYTSPWLPSGDGLRGAPTASVPASSATAAPNSASLCSSPAGMVSVCACVQPPAAYANANAARRPPAPLALIFYLSHQPSLGTGLGVWDLILRKGAHITAFGLLCLAWIERSAAGSQRPP